MPRLTLDYDKDFEKTLVDLVNTTAGTTKADVIRRAVASYSYLKKAQRENEGAKVVVTDGEKVNREIVLP